MSKSKRTDAAFARGELGADGEAVDESVEPEVEQRNKAIEGLVRNHTYLGREFLTWLLWRSNSGGPIARVDDEDVGVMFTGAMTLRGLAGEATELQVKGHLSGYSDVVKVALSRGLLVHLARLRIMHGDERIYEVAIDAEMLDVRSANIPKVLSEEEDDKLSERLWLAEKLAELVDALWGEFMDVRAKPRWTKKIVPEIREWFAEL